MLAPDDSRRALEGFFARHRVADLTELSRILGTRSRMSVFRRLSVVGYLSSYTHTGRYYTLSSLPEFDTEGLWRHQDVGFSRDGTLKATVRRMVEGAEAGRTQDELRLRLRLRVHNPLLELVNAKQLRRKALPGGYLYLSAERARSVAQFERRRAGVSVPAVAISQGIEVEVLLEVIRGARLLPPQAASVSARLAARGVHAEVSEVAAVLERHGLKKTARSRSRRSPR